MQVELADNQRIGPVHRWRHGHADLGANKGSMPTLQCRKGQIALFQVPHIPHDLQAEVKAAARWPGRPFCAQPVAVSRLRKRPCLTVQAAYNAAQAAATP